MDERTLLDFIELRLCSASSSRCELHISAEGQTEKLACGFLKTFLSHMRAAQNLYAASGGPALRLEGPEVFHAKRRPWFTKKTLERFVHYISAPEVLERVKTIEDELVQLEHVRSIQADSLPQVNHGFVSTDSTLLRAGSMSPEHHAVCGHFNDADSSKRELLKAMDVRLSALRQEQSLLMHRASAAGFDEENIVDLLAFSEFFGADRLRVACNWFWEISAKVQRVTENDRPQASQGVESCVSSRSSQLDLDNDVRGSVLPFVTGQSFSQCASPLMLMHDGMDLESPPRQTSFSSKGYPQRSSPRRRSASPLKRVQMGKFGSRKAGSVVVRSINYLTDRQTKERNHPMETSSSDSEDNSQRRTQNKPSPMKKSSPTPGRRLSVQAAINLFESKQSRESGEMQEKQRSSKHQSRRASLEGDASCTEKSSTNQEDASYLCSSMGWQESSTAKLAEDSDIVSERCIPVIDSSVTFSGQSTESKSGPVKSEGQWVYRNDSLHSEKQDVTPRKALNYLRDSSMLDDFATLEIASKRGSPKDGKRLDSPDDCISNAASTITSISQSSKQYHSQTLRCKELEQAPLLLENALSHWEGDSDFKMNYAGSPNFDLQALASLASSSVHDAIAGRNEGRFYEQYRKMRDAKMMGEQHSKRAEREAKLKLMEETLVLRKAEMDARIAKLNKESSQARNRAAKLLALRRSIVDTQIMQEDRRSEEDRIQVLPTNKDASRSDSSPPPSMPCMSKEKALTPKSHKPKKAAVTSQKSSTTPRSSTRAVSISPKTNRGANLKMPGQRSGVSLAHENSIACEVQCFSDMKKENSKPSPGKISGSQSQSKVGASVSHSQGVDRDSLTGSNGNVPSQNNSSGRNLRVDRKNFTRQSRQSLVASEFRDVLSVLKDEDPVVVNTQKDAKMEAPLISSKIRRSAVAPIQEVRPFLRKGSGIGPGAGPGVMKLKVEAIKSPDEDTPGTPRISHDEAHEYARIIDMGPGDGMCEEKIDAGITSCTPSHADDAFMATCEETLALTDMDVTHYSDNGFFNYCEGLKVDGAFRDDELMESEKPSHTISFPIDFNGHNHFVSDLVPASDSTIQEPSKETLCKQGGSNITLSQLLCETASQMVQNDPPINGSQSFQAGQTPEENIVSRFSPLKTVSLASSSVKNVGVSIPDHLNPATAANLMESLVGSPASWNSSHVLHASETDLIQSCKTEASNQKSVMVIVPPKEPTRGFKRLLKFGRRSRATPEIIVTDGVSASTHSEGDDDAEVMKKDMNARFTQDMLQKLKHDDRLMKDLGISTANGIHGYNPVRSMQSSIPIPPSNFKLKYDHASGNSKLKAPRSFFSLSTFRSKGSEGKSR
ncbi:hypothetical protein KP509_14G089800 [Ceratopteris richardii]|uniref:Uncharacterized protein n=4 Tax=Ceratopteris richardii TaxID=49495 RepID=A0A8T2TF72_CERRI|nr:hypothetical protein KP509_14G089800 [Ceratopteris richardii]